MYFDKDNSGTIKQVFPPKELSGTPPYTLYLYSNGTVGVVDKNDNVMWKRPYTNDRIETEETGCTVYGYVDNESKTIKFSVLPGLSSTFKFSNSTYLKSKECNADKIKEMCNTSDTCAGIIHSKTDNKWMAIPNDSTNVASNYEITEANKNTDVYLRTMDANVSDSSCPVNKKITTGLDYDTITDYPTGTSITNERGTNQCYFSPVDTRTYTTDNDDMKKKMNQYANVNFNNGLDDLYNYEYQLMDNESKLANIANLFGEGDSKEKTRDQQIKDSEVLKSQEKTIALIWGIVSVSMFLIILFRPRLNTT